MAHISYKSGFKYQLAERCEFDVSQGLYFPDRIVTDYLLLHEGNLIIKKGYAWDGPSGPTIDTKNFMRGSLVHDALYQLMRMGLLSSKLDRKAADNELRRLCREDGMSSIRAWWVYRSVRRFGGPAASAKNAKLIRYAPPKSWINF